jgi:hypothetical protein
MIKWFLNYYKETEDLGQPHHRNFPRFFLTAHLEGNEEGNKETQNT